MADYEPIEWNDDLVTGVDIIDEQHRILVNSFNEANAKLAIDSSAAFLDHITRDLLSYALYHFEAEETLMQEYGYSETHVEEADTHIQQHRDFSGRVVAMRNEIKTGHLVSRKELLSFLNSWLINHILKTDKKLAAFILKSENN